METLSLWDQDGNPPDKCCTACAHTFPATIEFFYRQKLGKYGLDSRCKACKQANKKPLPKSKEVKQCLGCGGEFPSNPDFFYRQKGSLVSQCKACVSKKQKESRRKPREILLPGEKRCSICKNIFPATPEYFHRHRRQKDGLNAQCKICKQRSDMEYRSKPESQAHIAAYQNRPEVKSRISAQRKAYRSLPEIQERDREHVKTYRSRPEIQERDHLSRLEYRNRPEIEAREHARRRVYNNLPEVRERRREPHRVANITHRARKKSVRGTHTPAQIQEQLKRQRYRCYYAACGFSKFKKKNGRYTFHVDHTFPISRTTGTDIPANDISYLVLTCPSCNQHKSDKYPWEWPDGGRLL